MKNRLQYSKFPPAIAYLLKIKSDVPWRAGNIQNSTQRGFTLLELLITMAISIIMTGVVVANYRDYTTNAYFANASEDIVLALRQAQVYGAGGKANTVICTGGETLSECRYGVHFSTASGYSDGLILFVDIDNDKIFVEGEQIETVKWKSPIKITGLSCGGTACAGGLDITFRRPNPDALITETNNIGVSYSTAKITISNGETLPRKTAVIISNAGQISLQKI